MATGFTNIGNGGGGLKGLTATPTDVRQGLTFSRDGKTVESGMMNLTNLRPENIKENITIADIVGTFAGSTLYKSGGSWASQIDGENKVKLELYDLGFTPNLLIFYWNGKDNDGVQISNMLIYGLFDSFNDAVFYKVNNRVNGWKMWSGYGVTIKQNGFSLIIPKEGGLGGRVHEGAGFCAVQGTDGKES